MLLIETCAVLNPVCQVCLWDVRRCQQMRVLQGHKGAVFAVDLNDDADLVYSGAGDRVRIEVMNDHKYSC